MPQCCPALSNGVRGSPVLLGCFHRCPDAPNAAQGSPVLSRGTKCRSGVPSAIQGSPVPLRCPQCCSGVPSTARGDPSAAGCPHFCPPLSAGSDARGVPGLRRHGHAVSPDPRGDRRGTAGCCGHHSPRASPSWVPARDSCASADDVPTVSPQGELCAEPGREAVREEAHVRCERGDLLELGPGGDKDRGSRRGGTGATCGDMSRATTPLSFLLSGLVPVGHPGFPQHRQDLAAPHPVPGGILQPALHAGR